MSAEYILSEGNQQVMLCERGIRTYETNTRNTLDLAAVPMLKELSHLPVLVDPSHGTGLARLVEPMALAAAAAGADGVMVEVHNDPPHAPVRRGPGPDARAICPNCPEHPADTGGPCRMKSTEIRILSSRPYDVAIAPGLLDRLGERAAPLVPGRRAALVCDSVVASLYGQRAQTALEAAGFLVCTYVFPQGEASKNGETYLKILEVLAQNQISGGSARGFGRRRHRRPGRLCRRHIPPGHSLPPGPNHPPWPWWTAP